MSNLQEPWGGGVSVENPHVQRAEYCRLLEAEYMSRLPAGRGHAVERDVQVRCHEILPKCWAFGLGRLANGKKRKEKVRK